MFFILALDEKFNMKFGGQLQILNFDPSSDSAIYECQYTVKGTTLGVSSYKLTETSDQRPLVTGKKYHVFDDKHENYENTYIWNAYHLHLFCPLFFDIILLLDRMHPFMPELTRK